MGDVIASIDARPASDLTLTAVYELFERAQPYKLTIRRGDETLTVTLTPRVLVSRTFELFPPSRALSSRRGPR